MRRCLVFLVDHGWHEIVPLCNTRVLSNEINIPRQAVPCKWIWFENFSNMPLESIVCFCVCSFGNKHPFLEMFRLCLESRNFYRWLFTFGIFESEYSSCWKKPKKKSSGIIFSIESKTPVSSCTTRSFTRAQLQNGMQYSGIVSDPSDFCVELKISLMQWSLSLCCLLIYQKTYKQYLKSM